MSPNAGVGGCCRVSANENSCAHHMIWSPNKLWRFNSIFNLCKKGSNNFWLIFATKRTKRRQSFKSPIEDTKANVEVSKVKIFSQSKYTK
jgi:hypothetical protein